jgi:hypothetical protein
MTAAKKKKSAPTTPPRTTLGLPCEHPETCSSEEALSIRDLMGLLCTIAHMISHPGAQTQQRGMLKLANRCSAPRTFHLMMEWPFLALDSRCIPMPPLSVRQSPFEPSRGAFLQSCRDTRPKPPAPLRRPTCPPITSSHAACLP